MSTQRASLRAVVLLCLVGGSLPLGAQHIASATATDPASSHATAPEASTIAWLLPVHSRRLSPGPVQRRELTLSGVQPFFLVGHDAQSLAWLERHAPAMQELGAVGLAVEVEDLDALQRIQQAGPGLTIWPVSGDDIATRLQLEHYPVLVTTTGLEQ